MELCACACVRMCVYVRLSVHVRVPVTSNMILLAIRLQIIYQFANIVIFRHGIPNSLYRYLFFVSLRICTLARDTFVQHNLIINQISK